MLLSDPSEWSLDEVRELISGQVPEGQRLDYKRELHLDNKAQKAEVAKGHQWDGQRSGRMDRLRSLRGRVARNRFRQRSRRCPQVEYRRAWRTFSIPHSSRCRSIG